MKNFLPRLSWILVALVLTIALPAYARQGGGDQPDQPATGDKPKEEPKVDVAQRQMLREAIDGLNKANKEKSDVDIIHFSKVVGEKYKHGDKDMMVEAVDALTDGLRSKNQDAKSTVLDALGETGGKASATLQKEVNSENAKKSVTYQCQCIRNLGKLKDEKAVDIFLKFLNNKSVEVVAQAISAMTNYREAKLPLKKTIVEELLKRYVPLESAANRAGAQTSDRDELAKLRGPYESSLLALTGKTGMNSAVDWDKWYRKEGKKADVW